MSHSKLIATGLMLLLLTQSAPGADGTEPSAASLSGQLDEQPPNAELLRAQIGDIAKDESLSFSRKEIRIANAVRLATATLLSGEQDDARRLALATELATAAGADLRFTAIIIQAMLSTPGLAGIEGAPEAIRAAAYAAKPETPATGIPAPDSAPTARSPVPDMPSRPSQPHWNEALFSGNSTTHLTIDSSFTYDDNVYLSEQDRAGDQIISVAPGADFTFGQNSLVSGSVQYQIEFLRYLKDSAPDAKLSHANAAMQYGDERINLSLSATYNEQFQNSRNTVTPGERSLFQTNSFNVTTGAGMAISPLTSISTAPAYSRITYELSSLYDNTTWTIPLNAYYRATAKLDVSAGAAYRTERSGSYGTGAHDWYYNTGLRGAFTAKLNGSLTCGYRTRRSTRGADSSMLGFTAGLNLELTAKTTLSLNADRDFNTSAQGQSLKNTSYSLALATNFNPRWSASARVSYQQADYGDQLYGTAASTLTLRRKDDYWEGGFSTSFLVTGWLNAGATYTLRSNDSSRNDADFSNNLFSISLNAKF